MRVLLIHNQHRSATPSGDNRVVEREGEALARAEHDVMRFGEPRRDRALANGKEGVAVGQSDLEPRDPPQPARVLPGAVVRQPRPPGGPRCFARACHLRCPQSDQRLRSADRLALSLPLPARTARSRIRPPARSGSWVLGLLPEPVTFRSGIGLLPQISLRR